jgi:hypothetical protein
MLAQAANTRNVAQTLALPVFAGAIFLSALLLFSVQPMFTKMVLPQLGGSPGVWSVAMVFFQGLLLLGYLWAHFLAKKLPLGVAAGVHIAICALVFAALPIAAANMAPPPAEGQAFWLIGLFAMSVGLPFFALSVNGPLLQAGLPARVTRSPAIPTFCTALQTLDPLQRCWPIHS